jgi:hypothetical protein
VGFGLSGVAGVGGQSQGTTVTCPCLPVPARACPCLPVSIVDRQVVLTDAAGERRTVFPAGYMTDSAADPATSTGVGYELANTDHSRELRRGFLQGPAGDRAPGDPGLVGTSGLSCPGPSVGAAAGLGERWAEQHSPYNQVLDSQSGARAAGAAEPGRLLPGVSGLPRGQRDRGDQQRAAKLTASVARNAKVTLAATIQPLPPGKYFLGSHHGADRRSGVSRVGPPGSATSGWRVVAIRGGG